MEENKILQKILTKLTDIKTDIDHIEKYPKRTALARANDILKLRQRVQMLERQVKQLQPAH